MLLDCGRYLKEKETISYKKKESAIHLCSAGDNKSIDPILFPKYMSKQLIKKYGNFVMELIENSEATVFSAKENVWRACLFR